MKKILFYTNGIGLGGVERALLTFLEGLDKEKYDIKVAFQYKNENFFEKEYYHMDFSLGNFFIDKESGKIAFIDFDDIVRKCCEKNAKSSWIS